MWRSHLPSLPYRSGLRGCPSHIPEQPAQLIRRKSVFQAAVGAVTDVGLCREQTQSLPPSIFMAEAANPQINPEIPWSLLQSSGLVNELLWPEEEPDELIANADRAGSAGRLRAEGSSGHHTHGELQAELFARCLHGL